MMIVNIPRSVNFSSDDHFPEIVKDPAIPPNTIYLGDACPHIGPGCKEFLKKTLDNILGFVPGNTDTRDIVSVIPKEKLLFPSAILENNYGIFVVLGGTTMYDASLRNQFFVITDEEIEIFKKNFLTALQLAKAKGKYIFVLSHGPIVMLESYDPVYLVRNGEYIGVASAIRETRKLAQILVDNMVRGLNQDPGDVDEGKYIEISNIYNSLIMDRMFVEEFWRDLQAKVISGQITQDQLNQIQANFGDFYEKALKFIANDYEIDKYYTSKKMREVYKWIKKVSGSYFNKVTFINGHIHELTGRVERNYAVSGPGVYISVDSLKWGKKRIIYITSFKVTPTGVSIHSIEEIGEIAS